MDTTRPRRVYIIGRQEHDFTGIEEFGEPIFLTDGYVPLRHNEDAASIAKRMFLTMESSSPDDLLVTAGLSNLGSIAAGIMAYLHGSLNLLIYGGPGQGYTPVAIDIMAMDPVVQENPSDGE